ncbi:MAG: hypothetical protein ABIS84_15425 [Arachnia sp.]
MAFQLWETIPPETIVADLLGTSVLIHTDHPTHGIVATFRLNEDIGNVIMQFARVETMDSTGMLNLPSSRRIRDPAASFFSGGRVRVVAMPPLEWKRPGVGMKWRTPAVMVISLITGLTCALAGTTLLAGAAIPLAALAGGLAWLVLRRQEPAGIRTAGSLHLDGGNVVEYARRRMLGERPEMLQVQERRDRIEARAESIRSEYEALLTDIVYRINNSALFDPSVPATERFQTALLLWHDAGDAPLETLDGLSADLEIAYTVARDNAETLGLAHLPATARPDARRAAKAARLAAESPNEGERTASLHHVARILDSLALYYLPSVAATPLPLDPPTNQG